MCDKWYSIIPGQKVAFPVYRKFHFLELPRDWKFVLFCQRHRCYVSRVHSKVCPWGPVNSEKLTKPHQLRHLQKNVRGGLKALWTVLKLYAEIPWTWIWQSLPCGLHLELPLQVEEHWLGTVNAPPWVVTWQAVPVLGFSLGDVKAGSLLRPPFYWNWASSELRVLLGRCASAFPKLYTTHI